MLKLQENFQGLDGIIGAMCSIVCEPTGLLSAAWNIPQVSHSCSSSLLSNKRMYPTFTRLRMNVLASSKVVHRLLDNFGWSHLSIISSNVLVYKRTAKHIQKLFEKEGKAVKLYTVSTTMNGNKVNWENMKILKLLVQELKLVSRIILVLMYDVDVRNFLILAGEEGLQNGDFIFIGLNTAFRGTQVESRVYKPYLTDTQVYQGVLAVTEDDVPVTQEWINLKNELLLSMSEENISLTKIESGIEGSKQFSGDKMYYFLIVLHCKFYILSKLLL